MDYPITSSQEGIKIRPEKMETDKLYHCIFNDKVMLFFKDHNDMLNCYEIDEKELVNSVKQSTSSLEIETILQKFAEKENLNH